MFRISNVIFFLRNTSNASSKFYNINEYFPLEDIKEPISTVISNLKSITFFNVNNLSTKKVLIGNIISRGCNYTVTGKDIQINNSDLKYDMNHYLTKIISSNIEIKLILKIEL